MKSVRFLDKSLRRLSSHHFSYKAIDWTPPNFNIGQAYKLISHSLLENYIFNKFIFKKSLKEEEFPNLGKKKGVEVKLDLLMNAHPIPNILF